MPGSLLLLRRVYQTRPLCKTAVYCGIAKQSVPITSQPSRRVHNVKLQFPPLPPEWAEKYKPGQMHRYRDSLLKLPVPPLQQTLEKYVTCVEPLLSPEELEKTKAAVTEFGRQGGDGEKLQEKLLERAKTHDNWLREWWDCVAYLGFRLPVLVHSSPAIGYPRQPAGDTETYIRTVTQHLLAFVKWNLLILTESISPDVYRKKPMCMSQFDAYSMCRIPGLTVDTQRKTPINDSRHVMIIRNGHIFRLDILYEAPSGELSVAPSSHILRELHNILRAAPDPAEYPAGILTTEHRDTWYQARERLMKDPVNRSSLDVIERAQFVVCMDNSHPLMSSLSANSEFTDAHSTVVANQCLHGNGSQYNTCNRWFDTSVQIVMGEDGGGGTILEHSAADGPAAIAVNPFSVELIHTLKYDLLGESSLVDPAVLRPAEKLQWNISPDSARDIETAKRNVDSLIHDVNLEIIRFPEYGKNFAKSVKMSPDAFIQSALQLAYYKLYGHLTATYESASTRWYKYGRTDTIRSATNASLAFVKAMCSPDATVDEKTNSLVRSVEAHNNYTNDAISGQAVDRHLLGLKIVASESGMEMPEIFKDAAFARSLHFCLSTSQVPVGHDIFLSFGAVVEDGYGVCYNPQETDILFSVSSFRHCSHTDSQLFGSRLMESLREMKDVLVAAKGPNSKF